MWAHSGSDVGRWHPFSEHAYATAGLARRFASVFGAGELAWALGLAHDAGKCRVCWQQGLLVAAKTGASVKGQEHKDFGAVLLARAAGAAALAILGHHGGLTTVQDLRGRVSTAEPEPDAVRRFFAEVPEVEALAAAPPMSLLPEGWRTDPGVAEVGIRLVFSALVDADHLDTAAHFRDALPAQLTSDADMAVLRDRFEKTRAAKLGSSQATEVNTIRERVYQDVISGAEQGVGVYRMSAPTGVGKTLSAAGFALHHAALTGQKRVIVAVPFITVTEQNAGEYREYVGDDVVIEHHSATHLAEKGSPAWRGAVENWDAPFVVTTTVQLFDSLFARTPSRMRKLHRLANSVLILDEVQALPLRVLTPILDMLRTLSEQFGTTVLLTSATQPSFEQFSVWKGLRARELVQNPVELFQRMRRVRYQWWLDPRPRLSEVAACAGEYEQVLLVVNTKADAQTVYQQWVDSGRDACLHLSTLMCPAHRQAVLAEARSRLRTGRAVRLVSTQLIEAGVDVDFPIAFRAYAPAESLQQTAGRVNREGHSRDPGRVVIFDAEDMGAPAGYALGIQATRDVFGPQLHGTVDPDDVAALDHYYRLLYQRANAENGNLASSIQTSRRELDYQSVAEGPLRPNTSSGRDSSLAFRMLDDDTIPVVIRDYAPEADELLERLRREPQAARTILRNLQPYVVALPQHLVERNPEVAALCELWVANLNLQVWLGDYDHDYGVGLNNAVQQEVW